MYSDTILENLPVVPIPPELLQNLPDTDQDWILLLRGQAARHHQIAQVGDDNNHGFLEF